MSETRGSPAAGARSTPMSRRAQGWMAKLLYLAHRTLQRLSRGRAGLQVYIFCAQPTQQVELDKMRADPNTVVVPVSADSPLIAAFPRPAETIAARFAFGATCYAILVKECFAGYLWLARGAYEEDEVRCRYVLPVLPLSVWDFDVYIEPAFRASRIMARLWKDGSAWLREGGVHWSFSRISLFNAASIQSHERLGALYVATGVFAVLGTIQLALLSTRPYIHLGWRHDHRPVLNLSTPGTQDAELVEPIEGPRR